MESVAARIRRMRIGQHFGRVAAIRAGIVEVGGLNHSASVGDRVGFLHGTLFGEVVGLSPDHALVLPEGPTDGLSIGAGVELLFRPTLAPCDDWIGRIVDPLGRPLDGRPLPTGLEDRRYRAPPPPAASRGDGRGRAARRRRGTRTGARDPRGPGGAGARAPRGRLTAGEPAAGAARLHRAAFP